MIAADMPPWSAIIEVAAQEAPAEESDNQRVFRQFFEALARGVVPMEKSPIWASTELITEGGRKSYDDLVRDLGACTVTGFSMVSNSGYDSYFVADLSCGDGKMLKVTAEMTAGRIRELYWGDQPAFFVPSPSPLPSPTKRN